MSFMGQLQTPINVRSHGSVFRERTPWLQCPCPPRLRAACARLPGRALSQSPRGRARFYGLAWSIACKLGAAVRLRGGAHDRYT